jgi:hypothetical protein
LTKNWDESVVTHSDLKIGDGFVGKNVDLSKNMWSVAPVSATVKRRPAIPKMVDDGRQERISLTFWGRSMVRVDNAAGSAADKCNGVN